VLVVIVVSLVQLGLCVSFDSLKLRDKLRLAIISGNVVSQIERRPVIVRHRKLQDANQF
jgi:hypothetical protein